MIEITIAKNNVSKFLPCTMSVKKAVAVYEGVDVDVLGVQV